MVGPTHARVRAYNVGFGDCLLLTFRYAGGVERNVMFDFGSTKQANKGAPPSMTAVANQIKADCKGGELDVLVVSHRHADHISGFAGASGQVIAGLNPKLVVQPWTEDPALSTTAKEPARLAGPHDAPSRKGFAATLEVMHDVAGLARDHAKAMLDAIDVDTVKPGGQKTALARLGFLGETNVKNVKAVRALINMPGTHEYLKHGDTTAMNDLLPGVRVDVLGPPTVAQTSKITSYAGSSDEYWRMARTGLAAQLASLKASLASGGAGSAKGSGIFDKKDMIPIASGQQEARWLIPRVDRLRTQELLSLVTQLDDVMNNTSLILTFQVKKDILLFPGDAQLENWTYALKDAPNAVATQKRLAKTRLYKVGHHGSLNATPKEMLWEKLLQRGAPGKTRRLISVLSSMPGKHGSVASGTEVPRRPLVDELKANSDLVDTETVVHGSSSSNQKVFWTDTEWITF